MNEMKLHNKLRTHKYIDGITVTKNISESNKGHASAGSRGYN